MNGVNSPTQPRVEESVFLSEILGTRVVLRGKKIGKLADLVIHENGTLPLVTQLFVSRPFGESSLIPWECVTAFSTKAIEVEAASLDAYPKEPEEAAVLLKDNILDKRALDLDGREVEVVYDVKLVLRTNKLYVSDVDLSRYGLLRRMGLKGLADFIYKLAESIQEQTISWTYIEPLPERIGRFTGDVQLKVVKEALTDMHPVDIADILEEVDHDQRVQLFNELDAEQASDTLEEISPNVQRDLVSGLSTERVAQLVDDMTPGQAADVLSALPGGDAEDIIALLGPENARKVKAILEHQEENILDFTTQEFLTFAPDAPAGRVLDEYRFAARGKDAVMYLFVVDADKRLLGVADIKEVLQADETTPLAEIMTEKAITLDADSTLKEAFHMFTRYNFRALPVVDKADTILGVVPYRDIVGLKHHFVDL
jgi:CBS domain-containing protein